MHTSGDTESNETESSSYHICRCDDDGNDKGGAVTMEMIYVALPVGVGRKYTTVSHVSRMGLLVVKRRKGYRQLKRGDLS